MNTRPLKLAQKGGKAKLTLKEVLAMGNTYNKPITPSIGSTAKDFDLSERDATKYAQQKAEKERVAQLQAHNQQVSATRAIDEGTYFTLPDGSTKKHSDMDFREKRYVEGQALRNRFKWDNDNPEETAWYNPLALVGNMAANLAEAPYVAKQTDSFMPYVTSVGLPLVLGRVVGSGSINPFSKGFYTNTIPTKQFVNNLVNPLAGVGDLVNNLGNKYLPNAYKLNPNSFKPNAKAYYRTLGKEGIDDAFNSGVIRPKQTSNVYSPELGKRVDLNVPGFPEGSYFNKSGLYSTNKMYNPDYIAEVVGKDNLFTYPERIVFNENIRVAPNNIPIEEANFYKKDWLKGYKQIETPKTTQNFKSEIDWAKWNKEIPENTQLMKEYSAIEQQTKANNTWMKNPDGSKFQGTPEQFVQQNSENFKKAFGNSKLVNPDGSPTIQYHGSAKKFDTFDESKFQLGDSGYSGQGIYTTPSKTTANSYATSSSKFHKGDIEPTVYELYGQANNPISSSQLIKENKGRDLFNFHRKKNWKGDLTPEESLMDYDAAIADQLPNVERIRPWNDAREIVFPTNKQLKSAVGNNGMFDMTNPNIYKALVPAVGAVALSQKQKGGKIKKFMVNEPFKYVPMQTFYDLNDKAYFTQEEAKVANDKIIAEGRKNQPVIKQTGPAQSTASKAWEVLKNPMTAAKIVFNGGAKNFRRLPDNFSSGETNAFDIVPGLPAQVVQSVVNTGKNLLSPVETTKDVSKGTVNAFSNFYTGKNVFNDGSNERALNILGDAAFAIPAISKAVKPLAGTGDLINNLGNKYLPNAHKLNPKAFKPNVDAYYRGLGKTGLEDAIEMGYLRSNKMGKFGDDLYLSSSFNEAGHYSNNRIPWTILDDGSIVDDMSRASGIDTGKYFAEIPKKSVNAKPYHINDTQYITNETISLDKVRFLKEDWLRGYKEIPKPKNNFLPNPLAGAFNREEAVKGLTNILKKNNKSPFLPETQKEFIENRVSRLKEQNIPKSVKDKLDKALENHSEVFSYEQGLQPNSLGLNRGDKTFVFKDAPLSSKEKGIVSAHEVGHYYENTPKEAQEWLKNFNLSGTSEGRYLKGKPIYSGKNKSFFGIDLGKGKELASGHANELRERAAQLKDYIQYKDGIKGNFKITESQLDDAIQNYIPNTGLDNNMTEFFKSIKNKKGLLNTMNKYPLSLIPAVGAGVALSQKQQGGITIDPLGYYNPKNPKDQPILIPSNSITMKNQKGKKKLPNKLWAFPNGDAPVLMEKGNDYFFPNSTQVLEKPLAQFGGLWDTNRQGFVDSTNNANKNLDFVKRFYQKNTPSIPTPLEFRESPKDRSTHLMGWNGGNRVAPQIVQTKGKLQYLPTEDARDEYAKKTGEYIDFLHPEQARWYAENGYKEGTNVLKGFQMGGMKKKSLSIESKTVTDFNIDPNKVLNVNSDTLDLKDSFLQYSANKNGRNAIGSDYIPGKNGALNFMDNWLTSEGALKRMEKLTGNKEKAKSNIKNATENIRNTMIFSRFNSLQNIKDPNALEVGNYAREKELEYVNTKINGKGSLTNGFFSPNGQVLNINQQMITDPDINPEDIEETMVHELSHASFLDKLMKQITPIKRTPREVTKILSNHPFIKSLPSKVKTILKDDINKEIIKKQNDKDYIEKDGMYPRIMQMRYRSHIQPNEIITPERYKKIKEENKDNDAYRYYDDTQVLEMLNTFVSNKSNNKKTSLAQLGGSLPKAQMGRLVSSLEPYKAQGYVPTSNPNQLVKQTPQNTSGKKMSPKEWDIFMKSPQGMAWKSKQNQTDTVFIQPPVVNNTIVPVPFNKDSYRNEVIFYGNNFHGRLYTPTTKTQTQTSEGVLYDRQNSVYIKGNGYEPESAPIPLRPGQVDTLFRGTRHLQNKPMLDSLMSLPRKQGGGRVSYDEWLISNPNGNEDEYADYLRNSRKMITAIPSITTPTTKPITLEESNKMLQDNINSGKATQTFDTFKKEQDTKSNNGNFKFDFNPQIANSVAAALSQRQRQTQLANPFNSIANVTNSSEYLNEGQPVFQDGGQVDEEDEFDDFLWEDEEPEVEEEEIIEEETPEEVEEEPEYESMLNMDDFEEEDVNSFTPSKSYSVEDIPAVGQSRNYKAGTEQEAYNYLIQKGLPSHVSAGIVGNLIQESGLNPNAIGDGGKAYGIAQWHPNRRKNMKDKSFYGQLDFLLNEASQRGDLQKVLKTKTPEEAAYAFAQHFERPKRIENSRMQNARNVFNSFNK